MTPKIRFCLPILLALGLGFSAGCKVNVSSGTSSADDAKADGGSGEAKPNGDGGGDGEGGDGDGDGAVLSTHNANPGEGGDDGGGDDGGGDDGGDGGGGVSGPGDISAAPKSCGDAGKKAGDSWKEDCNTCNCNDKGEVVCTRMACETDSPKR